LLLGLFRQISKFKTGGAGPPRKEVGALAYAVPQFHHLWCRRVKKVGNPAVDKFPHT